MPSKLLSPRNITRCIQEKACKYGGINSGIKNKNVNILLNGILRKAIAIAGNNENKTEKTAVPEEIIIELLSALNSRFVSKKSGT